MSPLLVSVLIEEHDTIIEEIIITKRNLHINLKADGMITSLNDIVLGVLTADCAPIFIYDNNKKIVCCLHSGWRGTLDNISNNAVLLIDKYNIKRNNLNAIIGPCLGTNNYEVDEKFRKKFVSKNSNYLKFFRKKNSSKFLFNLRGIINFQLKELGIKNIHNINRDTYFNKKLFFSHRRSTHSTVKVTGRLINLISLT